MDARPDILKASEAGGALISTLIVLGVLVIVGLGLVVGARNSVYGRKTVEATRAVADLDSYLPNAIWEEFNAFVQGTYSPPAVNPCTNPAAYFLPQLSRSIGQYGQITALAPAAAASAAIASSPDQVAAAGRCARSLASMLPTASAPGDYYFCIRLSGIGTPPPTSFFHNDLRTAFAEVHLSLHHPSSLAGASISCDDFRAGIGRTGIGTMHYSVYWTKRILGADAHKFYDGVYSAFQR